MISLRLYTLAISFALSFVLSSIVSAQSDSVRAACIEYTHQANEVIKRLSRTPPGPDRILRAGEALRALQSQACRAFPHTQYSLDLKEVFARMEAASTVTEWRTGLALIDSLLTVPPPDKRYPYRSYLFEYRGRILFDAGETHAAAQAYAEALRLDSLGNRYDRPGHLMLLGYSAEALARHDLQGAYCRALVARSVPGTDSLLVTFRRKMNSLIDELEATYKVDPALCLGTARAAPQMWPFAAGALLLLMLGFGAGHALRLGLQMALRPVLVLLTLYVASVAFAALLRPLVGTPWSDLAALAALVCAGLLLVRRWQRPQNPR